LQGPSLRASQPQIQEFPEKLVEKADRIFSDTSFNAEESGDFLIPIRKGLIKKERIELMSSLITGRATVDTSGLGTFIFKSVGMTQFDLFLSKVLYENSTNK
jgi:ornithine cyclodeaminase/alanine dehydrogenase-like protein (mu-crystallin family)